MKTILGFIIGILLILAIGYAIVMLFIRGYNFAIEGNTAGVVWTAFVLFMVYYVLGK